MDVHADAGDAGCVGHREVVARLQRVLVVDLDLAAAVHLHRAVDVVEHAGATGRADRSQDPLPVLAVGGVDRELAHPLALWPGAGNEVDALQLPARLGDRGRQLSERLLPRVELDPDRDAVLGTDRHGRLSNQNWQQLGSTVMELGFLILADASEAINGKVYALGAGWNELRLPSLPQEYGFGIALAVDVPWSETNRRHSLALHIQGPDGEMIGDEFSMEFEAGRPPGSVEGADQRIVVSLEDAPHLRRHRPPRGGGHRRRRRDRPQPLLRPRGPARDAPAGGLGLASKAQPAPSTPPPPAHSPPARPVPAAPQSAPRSAAQPNDCEPNVPWRHGASPQPTHRRQAASRCRRRLPRRPRVHSAGYQRSPRAPRHPHAPPPGSAPRRTRLRVMGQGTVGDQHQRVCVVDRRRRPSSWRNEWGTPTCHRPRLVVCCFALPLVSGRRAPRNVAAVEALDPAARRPSRASSSTPGVGHRASRLAQVGQRFADVRSGRLPDHRGDDWSPPADWLTAPSAVTPAPGGATGGPATYDRARMTLRRSRARPWAETRAERATAFRR